jgi:hypothetical protein
VITAKQFGHCVGIVDAACQGRSGVVVYANKEGAPHLRHFLFFPSVIIWAMAAAMPGHVHAIVRLR